MLFHIDENTYQRLLRYLEAIKRSFAGTKGSDEIIADPTLADAILDRLVHNAYKLVLDGESMRKKQSKLT